MKTNEQSMKSNESGDFKGRTQIAYEKVGSAVVILVLEL
jgi:hypothetical protein